MARIAGVNIPTNKRVVVALTYIHGIGDKSAQDICEKAGIDKDKRVNELLETEVIQIREKFVYWDDYFYPLDSIMGWNKIYGRKGFVQYQ